MVVPQFSPAAPSGQGFRQSQNLMMQVQQNRRAEASAEMDRVKFEILRPIMESEARMKLSEEAADLAVSKYMNDYSAESLRQFPSLVQEWNESSFIPEAKERIATRREILGRAAPFSALKKVGPVIQAWQKQYADDAISDRTADTLQNRLDVTQVTTDARIQTADMAIKQREAQLVARENELKMRQEFSKQLEDLKAQHRQELERTKGAQAQDLEKQKAATASTAASTNLKESAAIKANETWLKDGETATTELAGFNQALSLLESPDIRTGTAAQMETTLRRAASVFGADVSKVRDIEELNSIIGAVFLQRVNQMKGAISDKETATLQEISPGIGKSVEGNIAILRFLTQQRARALELAKIVQEGRQAGLSERQIQLEVNDVIQNQPISAFAPAGGAAAPEWDDAKEKRLQELRSKVGK